MTDKADSGPDEISEVASDDLAEFAEFEESVRQAKSDWRFMIGLETGALMFSLAFIREFAQVPQVICLLVLGWLALLFSILASVALLWISQSIVVAFREARAWLKILPKVPLDKYMLVEVMAKVLEEKTEEGESTIQQVRERLQGELQPERVKELYPHIIKALRSAKAPKWRLAVEALKFAKFAQKITEAKSPDKLFRSMRRGFFLLHYLHPISLGSFSLGIFFIALFAIFNLIG